MSIFAIPTEEVLPPGFVYQSDVITPDEHDALVDEFSSWSFNAYVLRGVAARRQVRAFGSTYRLDTAEIVEGEPWPSHLDWVRLRAAAFGGIDAERVQQVLVTMYPKGAPIGWHCDRPQFGNEVIGVSLHSSCRMRLRKGTTGSWTTCEKVLEARSAYVLGGESRRVWQHHIPPTEDLRYSITFRTLR